MQKPKPNNHKMRSKSRYFLYFLACCIITVVGYLAWGIMHNDSFYSLDKTEVAQQAHELLNIPLGTTAPVYSSFEDSGCKTGYAGFSKQITCSFTGERYYIADGDASSDLQTADFELQQLNMQTSVTNAQTFDEIVDGGRGMVSYASNGYSTASIRFYKSSPTISVKTYLQLPIDISLEENQYIYGIVVYAPYWNCAGFACPDSPSEPKE